MVRAVTPSLPAKNADLPTVADSKNRTRTVAHSASEPDVYADARNPASDLAVGLLGLILGAFFGSIFNRAVERAGRNWDKMESGDKVTLFLGIFLGVFISVPFLALLNPLGAALATLTTLGLMLGVSSASVYAMRSMGDVLPWQSTGRAKKTGIKILDTNVIIDGRIYDVARTGFLEGQIYVPQFVLEELQHIADSADPLRRQRGRRGLEVLRIMQADFALEVGNHDRHAPNPSEEVDSRLVRMAKALGADIVTNDWNLNRVASLQEVAVLNINDLALALKPNILPKELLNINLIREGNQPGQGVGYLDDGTMVVVENGRRHLNETLDVMVTQVIQTERGKMIFAELPEEAADLEEDAIRRKRPLR